MPAANHPPALPGSNPWENEDTRTKESAFCDPHREAQQPRDRRQGWMQGLLPLTAICRAAGLYDGQQTYAPSPCWADSTTKEVRFQPMPKKAAIKLWHQARDYERRTRQPGCQDGALGRNGLAVLHALIFDFLNYATGRLDPAYETIARKACISIRSAARGLAALKTAGVLNWLRRCTARIEGGRCVLDQDTNAYAILPASQWRGYRPMPEPPRPLPGTWGDHPPLPDAITAASEAKRLGASSDSVLGELESDSGDMLAKALADLGRAIQTRQKPAISDMPA